MAESCVSFEDAVAFALTSIGRVGLKLKPEQLESIRHVAGGSDVFVWLPTGFGKSIIYESLPFVFEKLKKVSSLILVVSPLVSLMVDQVQSLRKRGVQCSIMSDLGGVDQSLLLTEKNVDKCRLVFAAPEAVIRVDRWRKLLSRSAVSRRIAAIAVDEAHCVSKWYVLFKTVYLYRNSLQNLVYTNISNPMVE